MQLDELYHHAVTLLARKDYATGEMRRMLNSLANEPVDVDTVILKLKEYNYLNDERIAENLLSRLLKKQYGLTRIRLEIRQKGIESDVIENVLNSLDIDWFEMASESRIKKFGEAIPIEPKEKARQIRYLQSRGFSMDMIMESLSPQTD
ncbi:regulatory protein RecX [Providencia rettgeri]